MKKMTPMYVIFAGAIIIVLGTVMAAVGTLLQNKTTSEKSSKQLAKIEDLTLKNAELSIQLSNTALKLSAEITGEGSFCRIRFMPGQNTVLVTNEGKTPLYDATIRIVDLELLKKLGDENKLTLTNSDISFRIQNMAPGRKSLYQDVAPLFYGDYRSFNTTISTRSGSFLQKSIHVKLGEKWSNATQITDRNSDEHKIVFSEIDPDFPKDKLKW